MRIVSASYLVTGTIATALVAHAAALGSAQAAGLSKDEAERRALRATRTGAAPKVDGAIGEQEWNAAVTDARFVQRFPDESAGATERTELRVLYDDDAIYVAVRCWDSQPERIRRQLTRRDRDTEADKITVDIGSKNGRLDAYHFSVNASGVQVDGIRFDDTEYTSDWDGLWYSAHSADAMGWSVELAIPWSTLRYQADVTALRFQVRRYLARLGETDEWAPVPRANGGEVSLYGTLHGFDGVAASRLVFVQPYIASRVSGRKNQLDLDGTYGEVSAGADVRFGITSALTLDATFNPDFGQIDADQVVLNLSTFELFLPERRPFFLEGVDVFVTPFTQYHSRRIGAPPDAPDGELVEPLPQGRIWGALKLTGMLRPQLSVGVVTALTAEREAQVASGADAAAETVTLDPMTSFGVLRLKQGFSGQSHVGLTVTTVNRMASGFGDAYTGGIDFRLRTDEARWGASAHVVGSYLRDGQSFTRPDATELGSGASGVGIFAEAGKYGGEWIATLSYQGVSPKLSLSDAGFLKVSNLYGLYGQVTRRTTRPAGPTQQASVTLKGKYNASWEHHDTSFNNLGIESAVRFKNFSSVQISAVSYLPYYDNRETRDGARTERFGGLDNGAFEVGLSAQSDPRRWLVLSLGSNFFRVLNGLESAAELQVSMRPRSNFEIDITPVVTATDGDPRWFHTERNGNGSATYYFGELASRSFDVTVRATYSFTRTLTLQGYGQIFLARGQFGKVTSATATGERPRLDLDMFEDSTRPPGIEPDFRAGVLNLNALLRWEFRPGSSVMAGYTRSHEQVPYTTGEGPGSIRIGAFRGGPAVDTVMIKMTYGRSL